MKKRISVIIKSKNNLIKILHLLLGNELCLDIFFEIINFRLQLRNLLVLEIINKIILVFIIYTTAQFNWKFCI